MPPQASLHPRAQLAAAGRDPLREHLGKERAIPSQVLGAKQLVGQVLRTADGRAFRITGLDVLLPGTAGTYAITRQYGAPPDATAVAARRPLLPGSSAPLPWERPAAPHTTYMRATGTPAPTLIGPTQAPRPLTAAEKYIGQPLDVTSKYYGGATNILEANALTHASKTRINNTLFQSVQKFNRMAGSKVLAPSRVASDGVRLLRATQGAANFSSKFGTKLGVAGAGLSGAKLTYEVVNDKWNAHTFVDGSTLVVTIVGMVATIAAGGTAPVWVPVAGTAILIYGLADAAFDLSGQLDQSTWGRHAKRWK